MSTRSSTPAAPISPEEYLAAEREAEYKSEYFGGEILAMTGASREHNLIVVNLLSSLHPQLRGRACELYPSDMRVKIARTGAYAYPDVVVICGEPKFEDEHVDTLLNPTVLIEVLSPSTERHDRGRKWEHYRRLPSIAEFLLVAQHEVRIEHYLRQEGGLWLFADVSGEDASLELTSISCTLALRDVYDKVL